MWQLSSAELSTESQIRKESAVRILLFFRQLSHFHYHGLYLQLQLCHMSYYLDQVGDNAV